MTSTFTGLSPTALLIGFGLLLLITIVGIGLVQYIRSEGKRVPSKQEKWLYGAGVALAIVPALSAVLFAHHSFVDEVKYTAENMYGVTLSADQAAQLAAVNFDTIGSDLGVSDEVLVAKNGSTIPVVLRFAAGDFTLWNSDTAPLPRY